MKKQFKAVLVSFPIIGIISILCIVIMNIGCTKADSSTLFGYSYVEIPQSTVSGGQGIIYPVPTGFDSNTFNYSIDTLKRVVNVFLGVSRTGLAKADGYSVSLSTNSDTINQLITAGLIPITDSTNSSVVLLPASAYSLPATVSVPSGSVTANFILSIDMATLKSYAGKLVTLCVVLSNPTQYLISPTNGQVIVAIDVNALNLPK